MKILLIMLGLSICAFLVHAQNDGLRNDEVQLNDSTAQKYPFENLDATVLISSEPDSAMVFVDDEQIGFTPVSFSYPIGRYKINIMRENYEDIYETIVIKYPETKNTYQLKDIRASLTINTFNKAKVYINDKPFKSNKEIKILPQEITIRVEMNGAKTLEKWTVLGEKDNKIFILYPEYPTGTVQVNVIPEDASVELWEEGVDKYKDSGNKIFSNLPVGDYKLKVSRKGFKSQTEKIVITDKNIIRKSIKLDKGADVGGQYVLIDGGSFQMGSEDHYDEKPKHKVEVNKFYISKYEITQAQWNMIMDEDPCVFKGDSLPVENVSWYDAIEFCNRLSEYEGLQKCYSGSGKNVKCNFNANGYRLPTEAEWEYAARGGKKSKNYIYSGSDNLDEVAVYERSTDSIKKPVKIRKSTQPVGGKKANELGLYDMTGNVGEWCWDWYDSYSISWQNNPIGPDKGFIKVVRGGCWYNYEKCCRLAFRNLYNPTESYFYIGFRVVRTP